uniref:Uncharacterized protein n=1 Tax=Oncorhynchus tshawytscha TaxID=74940 RepID=A0AAZ3P108_ONCTS
IGLSITLLLHNYIEKRRCDRLNSLTDLRRLVPSAFEKQLGYSTIGSSKLEKAEILQITVDHLKMLHAASGQGYFEALAKDYRSLGFRECLSETARYLSIMEVWNSVNPLRVRLVSHLNNYASQRHPHWIDWTTSLGLCFEDTHLPHPLTTPPGTDTSPPQYQQLSVTAPSEALRVSPNDNLALSVSASKLCQPPPLSSPSAFSFTTFPLVSLAALRNQLYRPWGTEIGAF